MITPLLKSQIWIEYYYHHADKCWMSFISVVPAIASQYSSYIFKNTWIFQSLRWQFCRLMGKELFKTFVFISFIYFNEEQKTMCKHKLKTEQRKIWSLEYWNIFGHWNIWSAVVLSCFIQVYGIYMYIYSKNRNFPMGISIDMRQVFFVVVVCVCVACPSPSPPSRIHIMNKFNFTQQIN